MKKVLLAFAVATMFAACSDSSTKTNSTTDSTGVSKDTSAVAPVTAPVTTDTSNKMMSADTSKTKDTTLHVKIKK